MEKNKRIMFLDLMRVIALFMMIQGHTTYDFLDLEIRDGKSAGINLWTSLRGYTAPFFMLVSGAVFTYLMISQAKPDGTNPRIKAGLKRIFSLLFWGYLLNFPLHILGKLFVEDGLNRLKQVNVIETFSAILWISTCVFLYKSLMFERDENQKNIMQSLFRGKAIKHFQYRSSLFRASFFTKEELKKRINSSIVWGVIISIPFLIISNELTKEEIQKALRVDVLHLIAVGLLLIMLVHSFFGVSKKAKIIFFVSIIVMISMLYGINHETLKESKIDIICQFSLVILSILTVINSLSITKTLAQGMTYLMLAFFIVGLFPMVNNIKFGNIPIMIQPYLNNFESVSQFPITPWVGYIMLGAVMGTWLTYEIKKDNFEKNIAWKLALIGCFMLSLSYFGELAEISKYGRSYFWHDSPNLIFHRAGVVVSVGAVLGMLSIFIKRIPMFLSQMTANTLWLYVGHLVIIYQFSKPIMNGLQVPTRFGLFGTILCVVLMFVLMYLQTQIIVMQKKRGGYVAWAKSVFSKKEDTEI
jgi:uncharacterized membrane protein